VDTAGQLEDIWRKKCGQQVSDNSCRKMEAAELIGDK